MDNYPQIDLKKIIKGADVGTFYKVVKTRPEILDVLTAYEFDNDQTKEILWAFDNDLTLEQIKSCAIPDYDDLCMCKIYHAYKDGFSYEQMRLVLNPDFDRGQINWVMEAIENGWEEKKIKLLANPKFHFDQIEQVYYAIADGLGIMKLRLLANTKFSADQMHTLRMAFTSYEAELTYKEVKLIANHKFSVEQMSTLIWAFGCGLSFKHVEKIAKVDYTEKQMQAIVNAYLDGLTDEQMAFILNPKLTNWQMKAIVLAVEEGLSNEEIATIATGEYDDDYMYLLIDAYKHGISEYVKLLLNPEFNFQQAKIIWHLCTTGSISFEQIKFIASMGCTAAKMHEMTNWVIAGISEDEIKKYVGDYNPVELAAIRWGIVNKSEYLDLYAKTKFYDSQMNEIVLGIQAGFTREQLVLLANPHITHWHMEKIRKDIEIGIPLEKVVLYTSHYSEEKFIQCRLKVLCEEIEKLIN